jgi:hypothetical protein
MAKTSEDLGPRDDNTIESNQTAERRRWSEKLGVSAAELKAAIEAVGTNPEDVERYLRDRAQPSRTA